MDRREFIGAAAGLALAALLGAVGGLTAQEDGMWHGSDDDGDEEPP